MVCTLHELNDNNIYSIIKENLMLQHHQSSTSTLTAPSSGVALISVDSDREYGAVPLHRNVLNSLASSTSYHHNSGDQGYKSHQNFGNFF